MNVIGLYVKASELEIFLLADFLEQEIVVINPRTGKRSVIKPYSKKSYPSHALLDRRVVIISLGDMSPESKKKLLNLLAVGELEKTVKFLFRGYTF